MPTLLNRNVVVPHPDLNPEQKGQDLAAHTGKDYITNYITIHDTNRAQIMGQKVYVIRAGTGSGKSTILPPSLLKVRGRRIAITQPTRMTAEQIPYEVVKYQSDLQMGENIGYQTGLINKSVKEGLIYMTTGILLQQILVMDPEQFQNRYSTLIIDEVHKHDLSADFLLRALKMFYRLNWNNPNCPILILMSATIEPEKYLAYFETTNFIDIKGEDSQPIDELWAPIKSENTDNTIVDIIKNEILNSDKDKLDTLVFLPTVFAIKTLKKLLLDENIDENLIKEVYSSVNDKSKGGYKELFTPPKSKGRIILATNSAETGITFSYLLNVIDTGLSYQVLFNPTYNCTIMHINWISKASARQRRGRVGRVQKGNYYTVYTKEQYENFNDDLYPEMYTMDISSYILNFIVKYMDIKFDLLIGELKINGKLAFDPMNLDLIHTPSSETILLTFDKLYQLGLIDTDWIPSLSGYLCSRLRKLNVESSKLILSAYNYDADILGCIIIASCLTVGSRRLGDYKKMLEKSKISNRIEDEFIDFILVYELIIQKMQHTNKSNSVGELEKWFENNELEYEGWLAVIELINEIDRSFLIDLKSEGDLTEIIKIKKSLIEAYRLNILTWNDIIKCYVSNYKHNSVRCHSRLVNDDHTPPKYILTDQIIYKSSRNGQMSFNTGSSISILDNFVEYDINFMY
jgi:HrpA-like RNA helicase